MLDRGDFEVIHLKSNSDEVYRVPISRYIPIDPDKVDTSQLRDYQVEDALEILRNTNGIVQLRTGYGKTYLMAWLCKYLPRPILVTEPSNALCEEFLHRLDLVGVDRDEIYLLNPNGYIRSKNNEYEWMKGVKTLLSDEVTSITEGLRVIFERLPKLERCYDFSATPDKLNNLKLKGIKSGSINDTAARVVEYYGESIVYKPMKKDFELIIDGIHLGRSSISIANFRYNLYNTVMNNVFRSSNLALYIHACLERSQGPILFPYTSRKHVERFMTNKLLGSYKLAIWSSGQLVLNNGKTFTESNRWRDDLSIYDTVKYLIENRLVDLVFCSSVGSIGVDFPTLSEVILMVGGNAGNIIQKVGRTARVENPRIYMPKNLDDNPLYEASFNKRLKWIKSVMKDKGELMDGESES